LLKKKQRFEIQKSKNLIQKSKEIVLESAFNIFIFIKIRIIAIFKINFYIFVFVKTMKKI
jgi:hypothetical protein